MFSRSCKRNAIAVAPVGAEKNSGLVVWYHPGDEHAARLVATARKRFALQPHAGRRNASVLTDRAQHRRRLRNRQIESRIAVVALQMDGRTSEKVMTRTRSPRSL